ncbi:hypothetical protein [Mucilaginibacter glaciei]|uniref:Uncharacterized protein n=1 Tax=Mucilaginibacter glaciei TaxID=2772109 RepID=A0A926S1D1_9SPHI|nr:hypothetical protein [Mucilaginibacter glaciei]MBD1393895.1 hypothetical protein [Mucilaginibacter glaciei]
MKIMMIASTAQGAVWAKTSNRFNFPAKVNVYKGGPDDEEEEGDSSGGSAGFTVL